MTGVYQENQDGDKAKYPQHGNRLNQMSRQCRSKDELIQLGSAHEKYSVWTRPKKPLNTGQFYSNPGAYESDRLMQVHST